MKNKDKKKPEGTEQEASAVGQQDATTEEGQEPTAAAEGTDELKAVQQKNEELKDKYLRLYADFDNYKKRLAKEKLELISGASKDVILDMLPVLDDFERALKTIESAENVESVKEGIRLIYHKFKNTLEQKGVKPMDSMGKDFDTEYHEAVTEIPAPSDADKGKVLDVLETGYYLHDKIIRYAKVVVGK